MYVHVTSPADLLPSLRRRLAVHGLQTGQHGEQLGVQPWLLSHWVAVQADCTQLQAASQALQQQRQVWEEGNTHIYIYNIYIYIYIYIYVHRQTQFLKIFNHSIRSTSFTKSIAIACGVRL